ncbi:MAG TPA: tetratricopeptide repeat protein [Pyrinomonadaceae bacterium]
MSNNQENGKRTKPISASTESKQATLRDHLGISAAEFQQMGEIGAMYYNQGNLDKARTVFEGLVELDPDNVDALSALGALYTRTQRDTDALAYLNRAIELDDRQIAPHVNRAEVFLRMQKVEQAVADLKKAIELDPDEADPGANRARAMVLGIHEAMEAKGIM